MQKNSKNVNVLGLLMVLSVVAQEALTVPVYGSAITGVSPTGNEFNIRPTKTDNGTGFRHYNDFRLSKGDVANLIFEKDGKNLNKFVNLVDNRIYINGLLNTVDANGAFKNGHAVFVSPNGMVVGASGVLNVGSLTAIAPSVSNYLWYTGFHMGDTVAGAAADVLGISTPDKGYNDDVSLKILKEKDQNGDIRILGKIFARDSVDLTAKNVSVGSSTATSTTKDEKPYEEEALSGFVKAGIFAGLPKDKQIKMETIQQASNLFDALVANNIEKGTGFAKDVNGNIIIKAQSIKEASLEMPDSLLIKGVNYTVDQLFTLSEKPGSTVENPLYEIRMKTEQELKNDKIDLTIADIQSAYNSILKMQENVDAADPSAFDVQNAAKVNISDSVLAGKNVDVNAVSKVTYEAEKGASIFDRLVNTVAEATGSSLAENLVDNFVSSSATFTDFEGARANASVLVGKNTTLYADKDVDLKSLAYAETQIKLSNIINPKLDTTSEGFYYLGTKTGSSVIVEETAKLIAGEDVSVLAASKNSLNLKIQNPTSVLESGLASAVSAPSFQVSFLQEVSQADTTAEVRKGAYIKAGKNVDVTASNFTCDTSILKSVANVLEPKTASKNSGIAVAVTLKETDIDTSALLDGTVIAGKVNENGNIIPNNDSNVNVNAQNMHVAYTTSDTSVEEYGLTSGPTASGLASKITGVISGKVSGIKSGLEKLASASSVLPSSSVALVVNNQNINSSAKIGKNANIKAGHDVNVKSAIADMTVNTAAGKIEMPKSETGTSSGFSASGSVGVIVNNQKNNSTAIIEDGSKDKSDVITKAIINAGNDINIASTIELPMNDSPFTLAVNLRDTGTGVKDLVENTYENTQTFDFNSDWDFRVLMEQLKSPVDDTVNDVQNVLIGFQNTGISSFLLKGFFNNWAETSASNAGTIGLSASVVVSDTVNTNTAKIGNYADLHSKNTIVNAANHVVQFNAAGQVGKLWGIATANSGGNGIGGTVIVENVENNATAEVGDNAQIIATQNVEVKSANDQDFLTVAVTGTNSQDNYAASIAGTTVVQDVKGRTDALFGSSTLEAQNFDLIAGEAKISEIPTAIDDLFHLVKKQSSEGGSSTPSIAEDFTVGIVNKYAETDVNYSIDPELGLDEDDYTSISVVTGTGLAQLKNPVTIKDGISNIMVTGTLSRQAQQNAAASVKGSSGVAIGASVNASQFEREVNAFINNGANITVDKTLNVIADTKTQSLNVAIAGAFAGGADMKKEPGFLDKLTGKLKNKADGYLTKAQGVISKVTDSIDDSDFAPKTTGKLDDKGNPIFSYKGVDYVTDLNGQYYDPNTGTVLKDSKGNAVTTNSNFGNNTGSSSKTAASTAGSVGGASQAGTSTKAAAAKNMSAALAGSVNTQINKSKVSAKIGDSSVENAPRTIINAGKDVNVSATQKTGSLNVGGGAAFAANVGAGAAVNLIENSNQTYAGVYGADFKFTKDGKENNNLKVYAFEDNDNVQVALGVGTAKTDPTDFNVSIAIGGSFNADLLTNSVIAEVNDSVVKNELDIDSVNIDVNAENHSTSYKGAGAMSLKIGSTPDGVSAGAGMSGNINILDKTTKALIENSDIDNALNVSVASNKDKTQKTEDIIDVGVAGTVITGGKNSFSFTGAISTNVVKNEITAQILNSTVSASGDVDVLANSYYKNWSAAGALGFGLSPKGVGVGAGVVVNTNQSNIYAGIDDSTIETAKTVDVAAYNKDDLNFVAVNMGVQTNGSTVDTNGIVNVLNSEIGSKIKNSSVTTTETLNVISDYDASIFGVTAVGAVSAGKGISVGSNILSNTLLNKNIASIEKDSESENETSVSAGGKAVVKAASNEKIVITPVAAAVTSTGKGAGAANIAVNVVNNTTIGYIDGTDVTANGLDVLASDTTTSRMRGGTVGVALSGTVAAAGAVGVDTYVKNVSAYIDNATITSSGDVDVSATASNVFGTSSSLPVTLASLLSKIENGNYTSTENGSEESNFDVTKESSFGDWEMLYDVSGSKEVSVAGSLLSKNIVNTVDSYIGGNAVINTASTLDVLASNTVDIAAVVGNVSASGKAAIGANLFTDVNTSNVSAGIKNGAKLKNVGDIKVNADSQQNNKLLAFVVSAASKASVSGSADTEVISNTTNAYIENGVEINSELRNTLKDNPSTTLPTDSSTVTTPGISVKASDSVDVQTTQIEASVAGTAAVGAIVDVSVFNNNVNAIVGTDKSVDNAEKGSITSSKDIEVSASAEENYQANIGVVSVAGKAAVSGVVISETMASEVTSGIGNMSVYSGGDVNVKSKNSFNEKNKNQTSGLRTLFNGTTSEISTDDLTGADLVPLVSVLSVSAAGNAGVSAALVNTNVIAEVDSYVKKSDVTAKNLNLNASSSMTTYDAVLAAVGSANASVNVSGVQNVFSGKTSAEITDSEIDGSVGVNATDYINLNTVIFNAALAGTGAAVIPIVNDNVISNEVFADINNSNIKNASTVSVTADNDVFVTDAVVAGSFTATGAAVNVVPITNVLTGKTRASVNDGSNISGKDVVTNVKAYNTIDLVSAVTGFAGTGIGGAVGSYVMTNVFDNDLDAYINSTTVANSKSVNVLADSDFDMYSFMVSGGANGVGASVVVNTATNVLKNNVNSYILSSDIDSSLNKDSLSDKYAVSVKAVQNAAITGDTSGISGNGIGNATVVNSLVNVLKNKLTAYVDNTKIANVNSLSVETDADEVLTLSNVGVTVSGTAATAANSIVNVIENTSRSYIDAKDNTIDVNQNINVFSDDNLSLTNNMGMATCSAIAAVGANINVNVIDNTVKSELLSGKYGKITANSVTVNSFSKMYADSTFISASAGLAGIAGNVIINSIGSNADIHSYAPSDKPGVEKDELSGAEISATLEKANENYNKNVSDITYSKEVTDENNNTSVKELNLKNAYSLTGTSSEKRGTVANVNANVNTNNLTVKAENQVKGSGDNDALKLTNIVVGGGSIAAGASVLVTNMEYNTSANISGGKIGEMNDEAGINYTPNISVSAKSGINVDIDSGVSTAGIIGVAGNVGYTKNKATTEALISNAEIIADKINLNATSNDSADVNVIAGSIAEYTGNISIAIADTVNNVTAGITDFNKSKDKVKINANDIKIVADNTSTLKSELKSISVSGGSFSTIVNRAKSSAITNALIDATGTVNVAKTLDIIAQSGGINATTTMNLGTVSLVGFDVSVSGANVSSTFKAGVDNDKLTVSSENTNIKSGVSNTNNENETDLKAEVDTKNAGLSLAKASVTYLDANVDSNINAVSKAKLHEADNISLVSMGDKTAKVGSNSASATAVELNVLELNSKVSGSNTIDVSGEHKVKNNFNIKLKDNSNTKTEMAKTSISLIGASGNKSDSVIESTANINFGGKVSANKVNIENEIDKYAFNTLETDSYGLVAVKNYKFKTDVKGDSNVNITAKMTDTSYNNSLYVSSKGVNKVESVLGDKSVVLGAISQEVSSNNLSSGNYINFNGAEIKSKGNVNVSLDNENETTMQKSSQTVGIVDFTGGRLENNITANSFIKFFNSSDILANTIMLDVSSDLGNVNDKDTVYNIVKSVDFDVAKATINNTVSQTSEIDVVKSNLTANNKMDINIATTSNYTQGVSAKAKGILAKENADSILRVTNNNKLSVDKDSTLYADDMKIAQDSSNTLKSFVDIEVHHGGGRDPIGNAILELTVNNKILNSGSIKGGNSVEIDFMKNNSKNNLTQSSNVEIEAAIATGGAKGNMAYNVNNMLIVGDEPVSGDSSSNEVVNNTANITSAKDVIVNYTAGSNILTANNHTKKVSRLLFGIPIKSESTSSNIAQTVSNSLILDGEIVAGNSARRYMLIDKDGNVNMEELKGFLQNEYKIVNEVSVSGSELTEQTQNALQAEIDDLNAKIAKLKNSQTSYAAEISEYEQQIAKIQNLYDFIKTASSLDDETVANTMKNNIRSAVVAQTDSDVNKISADLFERIYKDYSDYVEEFYIIDEETGKYNEGIPMDISVYLSKYVVTEAQTDSNGNTTPAVMLSSEQITTFKGAFTAEENNLKTVTVGSSEIQFYGDNIITSKDYNLTDIKNDINSTLEDLKAYKNAINDYYSKIGSQISDLERSVSDNNAQIAYLEENPLSDYNVEKSAIEFDDLLIKPSKIELNGISNTSIERKGKFKTYSPNLKIDNYSNRDLIFKTIDLGDSNSSGLLINGISYADYQNSKYAVNETTKFTQEDGVHYISDEGINRADDINNIIINNYYDHSNPAIANAIASDITFNGYIKAPEKFEVFNDSGNIKFFGKISDSKTDITATQGSVTYNAPNSTLILQADDQILAGENVDIVAKVITVDGKIKAGYGERSLTITEDMLSSDKLVVDPSTGVKNMINLAGSNKSAYLNNTNNIKALYKDGKILLFNTKQEGGSVRLTGDTGSVTGNGQIIYTNGYADIKIDNQTSKQLVVNSLENNRMNGVVSAGSVANVSNQGKSVATTEVKSKGLIDIIGAVFNGKNKNENDGTSVITFNSENGVNVNKISVSTETGDVIVPTIDTVGDVNIINSNGTVNVDGYINAESGDITVTASGNGGVMLTDNAKISAEGNNSKIEISNTSGGVTVSEGAEITNNSQTDEDNIKISNSGNGLLSFIGNIFNKKGNITVDNTGSGSGVKIASTSKIENENGDIKISNDGSDGIVSDGVITDKAGNIEITNNAGELYVNNSINTESGDITLTANGNGGIMLTDNAEISAEGNNSKIEITNTNGGITVSEGAEIKNNSQTDEDNIKISNSGNGLLSFIGNIFNKKGNITVDNTGADSGVKIASTGKIKNEDGDIKISNDGTEGITLDGVIADKTGKIEIKNNANAQNGIIISTTGKIENQNGDTEISNKGTNGILVEGSIKNDDGNITVSNEDSDIVIGEYDSDNDNYISAANGNIVINQINGNILNGISDKGDVGNNQNHDLGNIDKAYKTLINANGNLSFNLNNGSVGSDTHALSGKESGFGVNSSTRDYTESINVKVSGIVNADTSDSDLFNLRAKDSDLNIGAITTDGNVMITVADWKQADTLPVPDSENYFHGYSVVNASTDNTKANITGKNISIISSDNIGSSDKKLTYNQLTGGSVSALSENDLNISGMSGNDTIWQLISKRGSLDFTLEGDAEIREITAAENLKIVSKGKNLKIYELGKLSNFKTSDDILYPHDGISFDDGDVTPVNTQLSVLGDDSTLNIYSAYVKGSDSDDADVILKADNIIAHAHDAADSVVSTNENPKGFKAKEDRTFANDITDPTAEKDLKAAGFNTVGEGNSLTFDVQGVSQDDVVAAGADPSSRDYNIQNPVVSPKHEFKNKYAFKKPVPKAKNVSISLNSGEDSPTDNRGMFFNNLYADNAYIDTKDLKLTSLDTFITNYGEFRNGNRGATAGGYPISNEYRWLNAVDNDYQRNLSNNYGIPITSQLYTKKTGSFYLNMGDKISQQTKAPAVYYDINNVVSNPDTENSFFRLTYKDNKIQYLTTTPEFEEIDKSTYLPNKREFIRFALADDEGMVYVSDKQSLNTPRIIAVKDISKGGLMVVHDGSLKLNEKLSVELTYNDISTSVEVEVVRLNADNLAGLKFINMDKATANRILQMNMSLQANRDVKVKISDNK